MLCMVACHVCAWNGNESGALLFTQLFPDDCHLYGSCACMYKGVISQKQSARGMGSLRGEAIEDEVVSCSVNQKHTCSFYAYPRQNTKIQNFRKLQEKAGKVQTKVNTANTSGPFFYDDVGVA